METVHILVGIYLTIYEYWQDQPCQNYTRKKQFYLTGFPRLEGPLYDVGVPLPLSQTENDDSRSGNPAR